MTLQDVKNMDCTMISADTAAKVIGCDPHYIRVAARQCPQTLGFPVMVYRSRVRIPRLPFVKFLEGA